MFTDDLYQDHNRIIEIVRKIHRHIDTQEKEGLVELFKELVDVMFEHNQREEHVFLPFASHLLCEDRDELSEKLENFALSKKSRVWGV
jgi:hemerythrin superfamily protein